MDQTSNTPRSFTGRSRRRQTRWTVHLTDRVARLMISVGGIGTIVAVSLVCLFLVWVVWPLFAPGKVEPGRAVAPDWAEPHARPVQAGMDEYRTLGWSLAGDGQVSVFRLDDGRRLGRQPLASGAAPSCWAFSTGGSELAMGFADGTVRLAKIGFRTRFIDPQEVPPALADLAAGQVADYESGVISRLPQGQFRAQQLHLSMQEPIRATESGIVRIAYAIRNDQPTFVVLTSDRKLLYESVRQRKNLMTGKITLSVDKQEIAYQAPPGRGDPDYLLLSGLGDNLYLIWEDGLLWRYDLRDLSNGQLVEQADLIPEPEHKLTVATFLLGKTTILTGDTLGRVRAWFRVKPETAGLATDGRPLVRAEGLEPAVAARLMPADPKRIPAELARKGGEYLVLDAADGAVLVLAHQLDAGPSPITRMAASTRSRIILAGSADGQIRAFQVTSHKLVAQTRITAGSAITALNMAPKEDGFLAATDKGFETWSLAAGHPEVTPASILLPVWYEGYNRPSNEWQSSSGTDDFEPKLSLTPLIFGTLKATVYSMLIGLPLAMLAAVYTSEFLHPRAKAVIKPTIELMASLPSVVLGFLAALVFAPVLEQVVPATLSLVMTIPLSLLLGAYLWQLLPQQQAMKLAAWRLPAMGLTLAAGLLAALVVGPLIERWMFAGDIRLWLDGQRGSAAGGWILLLLPTSGLGVGLAMARWANPLVRAWSATWTRRQTALLDMLKFLVGAATTLLLALGLSWLLTGLGLDPRGDRFFPPDFLNTFTQRNALVVGLVMAFAIIPIIYTIADDALSAVPDHLRSASLGAGATPWQTAVRIIIPTAMSGLFSATMIGLGRAVGETMIVLMAAGNTPVTQWNIFNGFRTLSANIAVEMPEAVRDSTHYRMLFLAALALFALTFALNTAAEIIRQRFRKRAYQL